METEKNEKTLLLVEDTEDNRFMMRRLLEMEGYRVVEARNGEEAVKVAQERKAGSYPDGFEPANHRRSGGNKAHQANSGV